MGVPWRSRAFDFQDAVVERAEVRRGRVVADQQIAFTVGVLAQIPKLRLIDRPSSIEHGTEGVLQGLEAETGRDLDRAGKIGLDPLLFMLDSLLHALLVITGGFIHRFLFGRMMLTPQPKRILE